MLNTTKTARLKSTEKCVIQVPLGLSKSYSMQKPKTTTEKQFSNSEISFFTRKKKIKKA